jgi:multiple sugar transport system ATP-binding protein
VTWGARPEYLGWSTTPVDGALSGVVTVVENLGASVLVTVESGDVLTQVVVNEDDEPAPGTRGWVVPRPERTLLFGESGVLVGTSLSPAVPEPTT